MNEQALRTLLQAVSQGVVSIDGALSQLRDYPFAEEVGGVSCLDHHRPLRQGFPEFVYAEHKQPDHVAELMARLVDVHGGALATRTPGETAARVRRQLPAADYDAVSRVLRIGNATPAAEAVLEVAVLSAGTSDLPVAEEAAQVAEFLGHHINRVYDVGVAGLHRLLAQADTIHNADVLIVVAGMDGALPAVVGGLVAGPVVAVPTSVGYGACLGGFSPLLTMLNACAAGVAVVNIDNGFGAALAAHRIGNVLRGKG